jgi:hypothetical protein
MKQSTLGESGVNHRPLHAAPILGVALAYNDDIERHPERTERSSETHHLGVPVLRLALDNHKVEIAIRTSVTARTRAEEHDLDRIGSDGCQSLACGLDDVLLNHAETVARLSGRLRLADPRDSVLTPASACLAIAGQMPDRL